MCTIQRWHCHSDRGRLTPPHPPTSGMGCSLSSWNGSAYALPFYAEIVPRSLRDSVFAVHYSFDKFFGAFASPLVAFVAKDIFGYSSTASSSMGSWEAKWLSEAIFAMVAVPFIVCSCIIPVTYWTYPSDREPAILEENEAESTFRQTEALKNVSAESKVSPSATEKGEEGAKGARNGGVGV
eukprot:TRINITY_DN357_c0_g2_i1.p1 TRINITY_DN357_c0_g2~~TRINITY_DN357_c0_g2_i1.p1  ORF type:complete len:182 (-),score=23.91 TRINITY_DN357_c0_g2_i1:1361-1906(-)